MDSAGAPHRVTAEDGPSGHHAVAELGKVTETLSQFIARVLNQLSLSAWLPAAALVLLLTFVVDLGSALDAPTHAAQASSPVVRALKSIAGISIGGALLLFIAVVVLTMVTQAFSFGAIRVLEGYWGTSRTVEWFAQWRCSRHRRRCRQLRSRLRKLTREAWEGTQKKIQKENDRLLRRGEQVEATPNVVAAMRAAVLQRDRQVELNADEQALFDELRGRWQEWAPAEALRRRVNVQKRLDDYPDVRRILPTKLGNVLRRHEDKTGADHVETFVQEAFDVLPPSMKAEHDEQRTRLDLYCSMVFVLGTVTAIAVARFVAGHLPYSIYALVIGLTGMSLMYRAAVGSARAYGGLLLILARYVELAAAAGQRRGSLPTGPPPESTDQ